MQPPRGDAGGELDEEGVGGLHIELNKYTIYFASEDHSSPSPNRKIELICC